MISPLILNIALHGLEEAAGVSYRGGIHADDVVPGSPAVTRYADDLVACCQTRQQAKQVKARLAVWLAPRGLAFNDHLIHHDQPGRSRDQRTHLIHAHCSRKKHPVRAAASTA